MGSGREGEWDVACQGFRDLGKSHSESMFFCVTICYFSYLCLAPGQLTDSSAPARSSLEGLQLLAPGIGMLRTSPHHSHYHPFALSTAASRLTSPMDREGLT